MHLPRYCNLWLSSYIRGRMKRWVRPGTHRARRVWLAIADHYEPLWNGASEETARERVALWSKCWPKIAEQYKDSAGRHPVYTFFYPEEQYRGNLLDSLADLSLRGIGDVEVHIHHDREGELNFVDRINCFIDTLWTRHGLLRKEGGQIKFGFIHGNWALDNSLPDGKWCGLNNEIQLLHRLGCYADFTMPSGASPSQASTVNEVYWATDDPLKPKSYNRGRPFRSDGPGGDLLMIPGPLCVRYRDRLMPRLDTGELAGYDPPTAYRVVRWLETAPRFHGDIFIKLYTHGAQERNMIPLLQSELAALFKMVGAECRRRNLDFYFVSTWQMYNAILALGRGADPIAAVKSYDRALV